MYPFIKMCRVWYVRRCMLRRGTRSQLIVQSLSGSRRLEVLEEMPQVGRPKSPPTAGYIYYSID